METQTSRAKQREAEIGFKVCGNASEGWQLMKLVIRGHK